jgi:CRP-like cAMP-binding protein
MLNIQTPTLNHLLGALPSEDHKRIAGDLKLVELKARQTLQKRGEPLREIYFPNRCLCSLVVSMADGATAEITVVGAEGFIGVDAVLGLSHATCDANVQMVGDGIGQSMSVGAFRRELDWHGALYSHATKYAQAFVGFVTQSVACNGLHSAEARCCRWLLHAQDRLGTNEFPLTHDLLSTMLGVRRPTVTLIVADLVREGIVSTSRGLMRINDRVALEARACECYQAVKRLFDNLIPLAASA